MGLQRQAAPDAPHVLEHVTRHENAQADAADVNHQMIVADESHRAAERGNHKADCNRWKPAGKSARHGEQSTTMLKVESLM
jgi:hypothetical protein